MPCDNCGDPDGSYTLNCWEEDKGDYTLHLCYSCKLEEYKQHDEDSKT